MKKIGLIGGMSWESSHLYYKIINEYLNSLLGGLSTVESILYTVNFEEIEKLQHQNKWSEAADILIEASKDEYLRVINSFKNIEGVILGCTEIGMLINKSDLDIKVYDTTKIHAKEAVN